ncbi:MAG: HDOD domain-containing protein [Betaproteobacteria bacterium]|nr:HDOD domain-containing protein [Betaproteobacteria bacterium]
MNPIIIAENVKSIFSLPEISVRINELINSGDASNEQLAEIILHDPALTVKLLKLANSPYFGFPRAVETVSHAVSLIGHKELRNLVVATSVTSTFKNIPPDLVDMSAFWYHSITCGVFARLFAAEKKSKEQERFFIAGLLQGIGKLVLFSQYPSESREVLNYKDQGEAAIRNAELKIFGFTHSQLSAELLKQWQLPIGIWKMIEYQSDPENALIKDSSILHVAVNIANCVELCVSETVGTDETEPAYLTEASNQLGLSSEVIQTIIDKTGPQVDEISALINKS